MSKKIVITGGAGFVGAHFVEHFLKNTDYDIVIFDKLTYASSGLDRVRDINVFDDKRVSFYSIDFKEPISDGILKELKNDVEYILHLGAESVSYDTIIPIYRNGRSVDHVEIEDLWNKYSKKYDIYTNSNNVEIMDIIDPQEKTLTIKNGFGQWRKIKQISRHWYKGKIINIKQKWGEIKVTPNHSIYNSDMELDTPHKDVELLSLRRIKPFRNQKNYIENFAGIKWKTNIDDLLYLISFFVSEGWTTYNEANGSYITGFCQNDIKDIYRIQKIFEDNFGIKGYINNRKCKSFIISNKKIYNFFKKAFGSGSGNKKLPNIVFKLDDKLKLKLWNYLVYFDGINYTDKFKRYSTNSKILASQLCTLLSMINLDYSYNRYEYNNPEWNDNYVISQCYIYNDVEKKSYYKELDYEGWVYDIEVDDTHKFVCGLGNVVVHNSHVDRSIDAPYPFIMSNLLGTHNMLWFARDLDNLKGFLYFSTDEVFGPAPVGTYYKEWDRYNSGNPYAATKAGAEELCLAYQNTYKLPIFITRSMNIFGERQHPEKFIPLCIRKVINEETLTIHADSTKTVSGTRHWIHARNVADAALFLLDKFEPGEKYNIVGEEISNLELAQMIASIIGKELKYQMTDFHSSRPGHDLRYAMDGSKMKEMGWEPPKDVYKSLEKTINWTLENRNWLEI